MLFWCFTTIFKENQEIQASLLKILVALSPFFFLFFIKGTVPSVDSSKPTKGTVPLIKRGIENQIFNPSGELGGSRTHNLLGRNQVLYPLSYESVSYL